MTIHFHAEPEPSEDLLKQVAALSPVNPFHLPAYVQAKGDLGFEPWIVGIRQGEQWLAACPAFVRRGRWSRSLEIESLPPLSHSEIFWQGFDGLCRKLRISEGEVGTYASPAVVIPTLRGETDRQRRCEHILSLHDTDLLKRVSSHHKRNIKRGQKAGLQLRCAGADADACQAHARLIGQSMKRRKERGEAVTEDTSSAAFEPYLRRGAGQLFQAMAGETVVSSLLVFLAPLAGYYHSAGTSPEGMACGASPWLVHETARTLQARGLELFNLGGAIESNPGLFRFKTEFGTCPAHLEAVTFYRGSKLWKRCKTALRTLRDDPTRFVRALANWDRMVVYAADPRVVPPPDTLPNTLLRKLTDAELRDLPMELHEQSERFERLGYNDAYAVVRGTQIAHVAWLVSADHDRLAEVRNVRLIPGEAEITHCLTLPAFRGQGLYPFAIRSLCRVAAEQGIRRVYMITDCQNRASQRGIEKAGLPRRGTIIHVQFPVLPRQPGLTVRTHRWKSS